MGPVTFFVDEILVTIFDELRAIEWPGEFIVEYDDGAKERLLRGEGVVFTPPADDPEGIGGICADLPKRNPRNQSVGRYINFNQLRAIYTTDGHRLWPGV